MEFGMNHRGGQKCGTRKGRFMDEGVAVMSIIQYSNLPYKLSSIGVIGKHIQLGSDPPHYSPHYLLELYWLY